MKYELDRRTFLKLVASTAGGLTLGELLKDRILTDDRSSLQPRGKGPGIETWSLSICGQCDAGCSIRVRLVDGNPKRIEGNPLCPIARGTLCPKGASSLQVLFDPDRWVGPVRRDGKRKGRRGRWGKISWENGSAELALRLSVLRERGNVRKLMWITGEDGSSHGTLVSEFEFVKVYGSPYHFRVGSQRDPAMREVLRFCQGIDGLPAYDFDKCAFILSLGTPFLENWLLPVWLSRRHGETRGVPYLKSGARFVQVESRLSPTAVKADEWVPVPPGMEAQFALALAHVIIKDDLYDHDFVREHCNGFEDRHDEDGDIHAGFRSFVLSGFEPTRVARETGVPTTRIIELAHTFANRGPSLAIAERGELSSGFFACWAAHCLTALVGGIDRPGGALIQEDPPIVGFGSTYAKHTCLFDLDNRILNKEMETPEIVILSDARHLRTSPGLRQFARALEKVPFVVSLSPFNDSCSSLADLVLPDHTFFEKWQDHTGIPWNGTARYAVTRPAVPPILSTRHKDDTLLDLARRLGGSFHDVLSWPNQSDRLRQLVHSLEKGDKGGAFGAVRSQKSILESGGWHDPDYVYEQWPRVLQTSSGKFTFLDSSLDPDLLRPVLAARDNDQSYSFLLYPFEVLPISGAASLNQPFLQEILSQVVNGAWSSWIEMNPHTAADLGIEDGDIVSVESAVGEVTTRVRLYAGAPPDVIPILLGNRPLGGGRWVVDASVDLEELFEYQTDSGKVYPLAYATQVRIVKTGRTTVHAHGGERNV